MLPRLSSNLTTAEQMNGRYVNYINVILLSSPEVAVSVVDIILRRMSPASFTAPSAYCRLSEQYWNTKTSAADKISRQHSTKFLACVKASSTKTVGRRSEI
jgi:hypothetical protein